ncbi:hypothetical protein CYMTET_25784 [Cymbomonas tetramitiformis]|uniref:Uncharacterized protein n=1 Tax=Cymbomonas tetramitiformis TaxID=36881 RepID=A0AAE0FTD3_9CHLO|nr:hypothetical protein CYMTET_25784 [Cymbomonas tetramitiformis]
MCTGGALASCGDLISQGVIEQQPQFDLQRNAALSAFGAFYQGWAMFHVYNTYSNLPKLLLTTPVRKGLTMSLVDNFAHVPLLYTPAFFFSVGLMSGKTMDQTIHTFQEEYFPTLKACWALWIPFQAANFGLVPKHLQVPFVNGVCLIWNTVLSYISHRNEDKEPPA